MIHIPQKLSALPTITDLGPIPAPPLFSAQFANATREPYWLDTQLNWTPSHGYDLSPVPTSFHPAILMAIEAHEQNHPSGQICQIHANQGLLNPDEAYRARGLHIDAPVYTYPKTTYPNNDVFVVSDSLPTKFYAQSFALPDTLDSADRNASLNAILSEQADENAVIIPEPHHMIRFDSFVVHSAQKSSSPTQRTFLMVRFFSP